MNDQTKPPMSFWVIGVLALVWNGFGAISYLIMQLFTSDAVSEAMAEQEIAIESLPVWVTSAYAIAVWGGLLASLFLLMRKSWAKTWFLLSLLGVLVQSVYTFFMSNTLADNGAGALALPIAIIAVAIYLYYYSGKAIANGWLK